MKCLKCLHLKELFLNDTTEPSSAFSYIMLWFKYKQENSKIELEELSDPGGIIMVNHKTLSQCETEWQSLSWLLKYSLNKDAQSCMTDVLYSQTPKGYQL